VKKTPRHMAMKEGKKNVKGIDEGWSLKVLFGRAEKG